MKTKINRLDADIFTKTTDRNPAHFSCGSMSKKIMYSIVDLVTMERQMKIGIL